MLCKFKKWHFFLWSLFLPFYGSTQVIADSNFINITAINDSIEIFDKTYIFIDSNNISSPENVLNQKFVPFVNFNYQQHIKTKIVPAVVYLKIGLINSGFTDNSIILFPGLSFDEIKIFKLTSPNTYSYISDESKTGFASIRLSQQEKSSYMVKLEFTRSDRNFLMPILITPKYVNSFKKIFRAPREESRFIGYLTSGMLFLILLLILVNYFLTRKKEFLYYLGYASALFILMLFSSHFYFGMGKLVSIFFGYFDLVLLTAGSIFYLAFIRHFLDTKTAYQNIDKVFKAVEFFLLILLAVHTILHYFTGMYWLERLLENIIKILLLGIGVFFILIALKQKNRLISYLALGSAFNIIFSLISLLLILLKTQQRNIFQSPFFYYNIGTIFSMAFFLLGLTYKNRKELIENIKQRSALKLDIERKALENEIAIIKAQQEERNRISADMHDDLGAGMTTIRLYSELAKAKLGDTPMPEIEKISSSANELLTKMNAIIWSMSSSNDTFGNMVAYIRSYSLEYFEDTGINCQVELPENLPNIVVSGAIRRNVFLVIKEALNNILKHSGATVVKLKLERVSTGFKFYIQDNGKGIDLENLRQFGNGLKNMKKRMDDIDVSFTIENKNGTLITLYRIIDEI